MWSYVVSYLPRRSRSWISSVDRMVIFFIELLLFCFSISNHSTRIFVAIMSVLVAALIGWGVWTAWESEEDEDEVWEKSLAVFRRTHVALFERVKKFIHFTLPVSQMTASH